MSHCAVCNIEVADGRAMCPKCWRAVPTLLAWALRTAWSELTHTRKLHRMSLATRLDVLAAIAEYGNARRRAVDAVLANDTR